MANFCTKCGTAHLADARFCEECGSPVNKTPAIAASIPAFAAPTAAPAPTPTPAPTKVKSRMLLVVGGAVALVVAGGVGLVILLSPEKATEASFSRSINDYFAKNSAARERLVCLSNLPYQRDPIRVGQYDQSNKQWLDSLAKNGVYSAPEEQGNGGFFSQTQYVYRLTAVGKKSIHDNKLCLAGGLKVKSVTGFDRVQESNGRSTAYASAVLEMTDEAAWLSKSADRTEILQQANVQEISTKLTLALVDKKWQVDESGTSSRSRANPNRSRDAAESSQIKPSSEGLFDKFSSLFSFGGHPLIGKWQDESGLASLEFTKDSLVNNGVMMKAEFKTKGDEVIVTPEAGQGVSLIFKVRDRDHISMDAGVISINLARVK